MSQYYFYYLLRTLSKTLWIYTNHAMIYFRFKCQYSLKGDKFASLTIQLFMSLFIFAYSTYIVSRIIVAKQKHL